MKDQRSNIKDRKYRSKVKSVLMFRIIGFVFLFYVLCFTFFVTPVHAAINNQINFQGKLTNADGTNVADSTYTVIFSLYNVSSSGTALWTETDSVTTTNGIFQVPLGAVTSLPGNVDFNNNSIYLGIKVGSDAEMTPRIRFSAVPYAFNAAALDDVVATESATGFTFQGGTSSLSTASFTTSGSALTFQPGVAEGLTIQSNGSNGLTLDTGGGAAVSIGTANATSVAFGKTANNTSFTFNNGTGGFTVNGTGTLTLAALSTARGLIFTNGTNGVLSQTAPSGGSQCLQSNSGNSALAWVACGGLGNWQENLGALSPVNITDDLLLGGTATASAKIGLEFIAGGTPAASISAQVGSAPTGISMSGTGALQSLNMNTLTIGGATTGNIVLDSGSNVTQLSDNSINLTGSAPILTATNALQVTAGANALTLGTPTTGGNIQFFNSTNTISNAGNLVLAGTTGINLTGNSADINFSGTGTDSITTAAGQAFALTPGGSAGVGINTVTPLAAFDVRGNSATTPVASVSGATNFAAMIVNNSGTGDLFAASSAGLAKFTVQNSGSIVLGADGSVTALPEMIRGAQVAGSNTTGGNLTLSAGNGTGIGGSGNINFNVAGSNANTITLDSSTSSSIASNSSQMNFPFTTGSNSNRILIVGVETQVQTTTNWNVTGISYGSQSLTKLGSVLEQPGGQAENEDVEMWYLLNPTTGTAQIDIKTQNYPGTIPWVAGAVSYYNVTQSAPGSHVASNANTTTATNTITGGSTGDLVVDTLGNGDNSPAGHTASASVDTLGQTQLWNLANSADSFPADVNLSAGSSTPANSGSTTVTWNVGATTNDTAWGDVAALLAPSNNPTASDTLFTALSIQNTGNLTLAGTMTEDGTGTSTFDSNTLSLAGTNPTITTATNNYLAIDPAGTGDVIINSSGTTPLASLDVRSNSATTAVASVSGSTSFAGLVVNNSGSGDLFTASSAGSTKFTIKNSGSVVFGGNDTTISSVGTGTSNNGSGAVENDLGDEGSLVPNAGFEAASGQGGFADSWVAAASTSATVTRDISTEAKGNASAKVLTSAANQLVAFYSACMPLSLSVGAGGGNYNLNYYLKYASATKLATVRAYIDGYTSEANCNSNTTPTTSAPVNTTNLTGITWQLVSGTTIPLFGSALTWGRVHFFVTNSTTAAQVNIDGVRLIETTNISGLDYAEDYPADPANIPQPGQVVSLEDSGTDSQVSPSSVYMDQSSIGVVSTNPGDVLDDGSMTNPVPIALAGRVPVNVSTANGPIQVGDYLTSSTTPGVAVKAINAGPVIGTAMEDDTDTNTADINQVTMFIKNTYYSGGTQSSTSGLDLLSNEQDASVILQLLQGTQTQSASSSSALSDIVNGNGTDGLSLLLSAISGHVASGSASQIATSSANFQTNQLTINGLTVSGSATISADLHVKGNGLVEGILHIADTLFANNFIANGVSDFFGNVIFHSGVTFTNAPVFDKDTAGFAVISKGADHVDVTFSAPYDQTPIINASITLNPITPTPNESLDQQQMRESQLESAVLGNVHYIIINRTTKGFTILLDQPAAEDISFSWVALAVNSPVIFQSNGQNLQIPTPTEDVSPSPIDTIIPSGIPVSPILTPTGDDTPTPDAGG